MMEHWNGKIVQMKKNNRKKFYIVTTVPASLNFFKGQLAYLSNDFEVVAISSDKKNLEHFGEGEGIDTYHIPMERPISLLNDFKSLIRFLFFFSKKKPDIVHGNTPKGSFLSMIAAKLTSVPVRIYMCHGLRYQGYGGLMRTLLKTMERVSCYCATEVLCVSNGVKATLMEDGISKASKLKVIWNGSANGIDTDRFDRKMVSLEALSSIANSVDRFVFCFVGRIVKDKGINELVLAFNRLSAIYNDINLMLIGQFEDNDNPVDKTTKEDIHSNSKIHFWGIQKDVRPFMCASDVFVLPSYREGFGMVLMEAGALGVPCITTDINGCNEIIQDGVNGRIIPPRDEEALYKAMKWMYEHRNAEVKEMAKRASPMIIERYEQHKVWEALLEEYRFLDNNV